MNEQVREIIRCLKRLERSDTTIKRRNARKAWARAMRELNREVDLAYRPLRGDGSVVTKAQRHGVQCPLCEVPLQSTTSLLWHLRRKHGWGIASSTCTCGKKHRNDTGLVRHLAQIKCLPSHFAGAALQKAANANASLVSGTV